LLAARNDKEKVDNARLGAGKDKVMMGAERQHDLSATKKNAYAYHEAGMHWWRSAPAPTRFTRLRSFSRMGFGSDSAMPMDEKHTYPREYLLNNWSSFGAACRRACARAYDEGARGMISKRRRIWRAAWVCEWE